MTDIPIRYAEPGQEKDALQKVAAAVSRILTPNEEILFVAMQNITALNLKKDSVVATSNRLIFYRPSILGRVDFEDFQWQDVRNTRLNQAMLASVFTAETVDGRTAAMEGLDKDQAKRLYGVCQQMEQEWREKRRIREMEEARARAGGVVIGAQSAPPAADDPVAKLARAKEMLDKGLISEAEYDSLKAKILTAM